MIESYTEYIILVQRQQGGTATGDRTVRFTAGKTVKWFWVAVWSGVGEVGR